MPKIDIINIRRHAILDNREAQYALGMQYLENKKMKDIDKAVFWFTKSAELGLKESMSMLGNIYGTNKYGLYNKELGIYYLELAYNHGDFTAALLLSLLKR